MAVWRWEAEDGHQNWRFGGHLCGMAGFCQKKLRIMAVWRWAEKMGDYLINISQNLTLVR
ncbi:MAG: hypothetical protein MJY83_07105 [Bacteroidales bacterium]|nr:hypothetical protein [Bacteroidales bacterium]